MNECYPTNCFRFEGEGTVLHVLTDLGHYVSAGFSSACQSLLDTSAHEIHIDLSQIAYVCSTCLGELMLANERVKDSGRKLCVRIPRELVTIFDLLSLREFIHVEILNGEVP